jgi:hypothetical protein
MRNHSRTTLRRRITAAVLLLATAGCAAASVSVSVAAGAQLPPARAETLVERQAGSLAPPDLGSGWVGLPAAYPLTEATYRTLVGVRDDSGTCEFNPTVTASPARPVQLSRTRASNESRCLEIVEVGVPPDDVVARYDAQQSAAPGPDEATATITEESPNSGDLSDEVTPEAGVGDPPTPGVHGDAAFATVSPPCTGCRAEDIVSQTGYYRAWFEDPPPFNIDVNVVRQELYWSHEGVRGCVRSDHSELKTSVFEPTGWYLNRQNRRAGHTCSRAFSSGFAKFTNETFCRSVAGAVIGPASAFIKPTRTFYNRAIARGYNTGKITGNTRHSKKGGCAFALSFNGMARHYG